MALLSLYILYHLPFYHLSTLERLYLKAIGSFLYYSPSWEVLVIKCQVKSGLVSVGVRHIVFWAEALQVGTAALLCQQAGVSPAIDHCPHVVRP